MSCLVHPHWQAAAEMDREEEGEGDVEGEDKVSTQHKACKRTDSPRCLPSSPPLRTSSPYLTPSQAARLKRMGCSLPFQSVPLTRH